MRAAVVSSGFARRFLAALALLVAVLPLKAQVQPVTAYYAVVSADDTPLRSGAGELLYPVAKLTKGTLLRVDGQGQGWLRVAYPPGTQCFVPADSVQVDAASKTVSLTKPTSLKASNLTTGYKGSWKDVLEQPLPVSAKLTLVDADPVNDGRGNAAYRVVPHEQARAYIQESTVTRATQEQINQYLSSKGDSGKHTDKPVVKTNEKPADKPADKQTAQVPDKPQDKPADPGTNLTEPKVTPSAQAPTDKPADTAQAPEPKPLEVPKNPWEKLETAFEGVRRQPTDSAEFTALMGEYQDAIDKLANTPQNETIARSLKRRLEYLKLQVDIQTKQRELAATKQNLTVDEQKLADKLKDVERTRQYTIVGRLSASTVYDGKRLPLMYRILAVGGTSSRTLAYIKPDEKLKVDSKLGQIVGVLGESRLDPTLKSNVITPVRIDTLEAAPAPAAAPASPGSEPPPAPKPAAEVPAGGPGGH